VGLPCPAATETWKPVPHNELVNHLIDGLTKHDISIRGERYCVSGKDDARIFGILDVLIPNLATPEYTMVLGFRGANDKSLCIQATAGARVTICDNLAFSGDSGTVVLKKKHTARLDLTRVVPPAIDAYLEKAGQFTLDLKVMQEMEISAARAKEIIYDAFIAKIMNQRFFPLIHHLYFNDEEQKGMFPERTAWSLNNSFTQAVKSLTPTVADDTGRRIGRFFARLVNRDKAPALGWEAPVDEAEELEGEIIQPNGELLD
jgi:hypothetical protein